MIGAVEIYHRMEAISDLGLPNIAPAEYRVPDNVPAADFPLCKARRPVTAF